ncbi:DUF4390 domain-containing protein [Candidatus Dactylopiibacterium carminicum]|nr:DUF4390 domain-containing protein [Candidatus Dactylopiibacterium carminicum]
MTASTSPCWRKSPEPIRAIWHSLLAILVLSATLMLASRPAQANDTRFRSHELVQVDDSVVLNAAVTMTPGARLQELVDSGLSVPFRLEFVLTRPRWYWLDETVISRNLDLRLSYHALTRQYRLAVGSIHRSFAEFDDALRAMLTVRNWEVADGRNLRERRDYKASLRFRLDITQLPKPFQVAAFGDSELDLSTGWVSWQVRIDDTGHE